MLYMERAPGAALSGFVRTLWYVRAGERTHNRERVLPSGCVQVILNLAREFLLDCREGQSPRPTAPALVVGARSTYEIIDSSDLADLIGVVFTPAGFSGFARAPADRFTNRSVPLTEVWRAPVVALRERLMEATTPEKKLDTLEQFITEHFKSRLVRSPMVEFAIKRLGQVEDVSSVREVARSTGWSERHFSQVFRETVGLAPKTWYRVQRFQRALRQLHQGTEVRWAELALSCGYYDQSHFANEFRAFSGVDATTYTAGRTLWTGHIVED